MIFITKHLLFNYLQLFHNPYQIQNTEHFFLWAIKLLKYLFLFWKIKYIKNIFSRILKKWYSCKFSR